jgi:hypothetical protein
MMMDYRYDISYVVQFVLVFAGRYRYRVGLSLSTEQRRRYSTLRNAGIHSRIALLSLAMRQIEKSETA